MSTTRYPAITDFSLCVLLATEPGGTITPGIVDKVLASRQNFTLTSDTFELCRDDLAKAHLIDQYNQLTTLGDKYADMWRRFLAKPKTDH